VKINEDIFLAFILQGSMNPNVAVTEDFERCIKLAMQQDPQHLAPTFDKMIHKLDMCRQQEELNQSKSKISAGLSATATYEATATVPLAVDSFDHTTYLAGVAEEQWPEAMHFCKFTANRCFSCGKADHYIQDCLSRARGLAFNKKARGPGALSYQLAQSHMPNPQQLQFFPFVGAMYPPPGLPFTTPPYPPEQHVTRPTNIPHTVRTHVFNNCPMSPHPHRKRGKTSDQQTTGTHLPVLIKTPAIG
jgi:hypothetical protein